MRKVGVVCLAALVVAVGAVAAGWPTFQAAPGRPGRTTVTGPLGANLQWSFPVDGVPASPVVGADGTVYLPTGMPDTDALGYLYAITPDATEATLLWRMPLAGPPGSTAPAVAPDGTVYVHTNGATVETLHAFDADGGARWSFPFGTAAAAYVQSSPAVGTDGTIYVGSQDGFLYAINPNGTLQWKMSPTHSSISSSPTLAGDGTVYVHDHAGLYAYSPAGVPLWHTTIGATGGIGSPSIASGGLIVFVHQDNDTAYAVNPDGTVKWSRVVGTQPVATPAIAADGTIYLGANGLYAVNDDPTGTARWRFSDATFSSASPIVGGDGTVYWRETTHLYAVTPDGAPAWLDDIPFAALPGLDPTPALGADGTLYVPVSDPLSGDQLLLAYRNCPADCDDGNPCSADTCDPDAGCRHAEAADGTRCDDATVCNGLETCAEGACVAAAAPDCDDHDACTADSCDALLGCRHPIVPNGSSCPDADVCNGTETCQLGVCTAGAAPDCDDQNACTTDACSPVSGCTHTPIANCTPCHGAAECSDGNACSADTCAAGRCEHTTLPNGTACADENQCNGGETCLAGICMGGTPVDCGDGNACTLDDCDPQSGCRHTNLANGTTCADSNQCNGAETCQNGACAAGTPLTCADGNPCTADACNAATGCRNTPVADGTACADGNVCNGTETCQHGTCSLGAALACDDQNPCTSDSCDPQTGCHHADVPDGTSCSDADACNGAETCAAGVCVAATPPTCDDGKPCTVDGCNPAAGCTHVPTPNCTACDSNDDCDDANPCTGDVCSDADCQHLAVPEGATCTDGTLCNGIETCQGGQCVPGTPLECDDDDPCTADVCDPVTGCANAPVADGTPCLDGDLCNGAETCRSGRCAAGGALDCDDQNPCTLDICQAEVGCLHPALPGGTPCADGTVCNGAETCTAGVCTAGTALGCDDHDPCTDDACNAISGCSNTPRPSCKACATNRDCNDGNPCTADACVGTVCQNTSVADNTSCSDGNLCNGTERCLAGVCSAGAGPACDDHDVCTRDFCDPFAGCQHSAVADGASCSNGAVCDGDEVCVGGVCQTGIAVPTCNDANPCTADDCEQLVGCRHARRADGTPCADGNACNGEETCRDGACAAGVPPVCDDANPCTIDTCDASAGCVHAPATNGSACNDADPCDGAESCLEGACVTGPPPSCDDGDPCTVDGCVPGAGCSHDAVEGFEAVSCVGVRGLEVSACAGQRIPRGVARRFARAKGLIERAERVDGVKRSRALRRAARRLAHALTAVEHHRGGRALDDACADALAVLLRDAVVTIQGEVRR